MFLTIHYLKSTLAVILLLALLISCKKHSLPENTIGDVHLLDSQVMIKSWEISGAYQDTADYTWHEFASAKDQAIADDVDYANYSSYKSKLKHRSGREYKGKFIHLYDAEPYAVNAILKKNNERYNFDSKKPFTIQFNVKLNEGDKSYSYLRPSILSKRASFKDGEPGWCIYLEGGIWKFGVGQAEKKSYAADGVVINDGSWHTLTASVSFEKGLPVIRTFTDGEYNSELYLPTDYGSLNSNAPLTLGFLPGNINNPADILVSELKIWNEALSNDKLKEMGELFVSATSFGEDKNLIGYWPCNEEQGEWLKNHSLPGSDFMVNGGYNWARDTSVIGRSLPLPGKPFIYHQENDFVHLNKVIQTNGHDTYSQAGCYAACVINSKIDQDVAFLVGMHDAVKIWVNKKLCMRQLGHNLIGKNQYAQKVHLNKGPNEVVVKIYNSANSNWGFHLDVSSVNYVRKYAIGVNYYSIFSNYLVKENEKLHLKIEFPSFVPTASKVKLQVFDTKNNRVISYGLPAGRNEWKVPVRRLPAGAYRCVLTTDADTIEQKMVYGDFQKVFLDYQLQAKALSTNDMEAINTETLCKRFLYLDDFGKRNGFNEGLERKISGALFELGEINAKLAAKLKPFKGIPGLHIRGFRSAIDGGVDNYMVAVPDKYDGKKSLPLVVMMPYVTKQAPFIESWHVADIDRIELITKLCNRYNFAAIWPSSRIYKEYNLNPIVSAATFEAINAVKKDYSIDAKRLYLYGDCSGGMEALLIAARYPDIFAAIGVEGPDLSYTKSGTAGYNETFPLAWVNQNNLLKLAENYQHIPTLIIHTKKDEKADYALSKILADSIKKYDGTVELNNLNNATKTNKIKMISEGIIISKIFEFYKNKQQSPPKEVSFSTYQLKYNKAYWLTINNIYKPYKAKVQAKFKGNNVISINATNIINLTLDVNYIPGIAKRKPLTVNINQKIRTYAYPYNGKLDIALVPNQTTKSSITHKIEGPINDLFSSKFIIVQGTAGSIIDLKVNQSALDTFRANWKSNYFNDCPVVLDTKLTNKEIRESSIILIGSPVSNKIFKSINQKLLFKVDKGNINFDGRSFKGAGLSYSVIYPNPLNTQKYILLIGTNGTQIPNSLIKDMPIKGFYDFQIVDNVSGYNLYQGYLNNVWNK
ncbi:MAG TPA: PHB depolymerase family esterase [Segetibacter sp.]|jgi:hypothetical protein